MTDIEAKSAIWLGQCDNCGGRVAAANPDRTMAGVKRLCPVCDAIVDLAIVTGKYSAKVPCNDACQFAFVRTCTCNCGGDNHGIGYIDAATVPARIRRRDALHHARVLSARERTLAMRREAVALKVAAVVAEHPLLAHVTTENGAGVTERFGGGFITDVAWKLRANGELSPRQLSSLETAIARTIKAEEREAHRAERKALLDAGQRPADYSPAPSGRVEVTGEIVSVKGYENSFSPYAGATTWKMLVRADAGYKVWATIPNGIRGIKGERIRFTAMLTPKTEDPEFAIAKRPSKAETLSEPVLDDEDFTDAEIAAVTHPDAWNGGATTGVEEDSDEW